MPGHAVHLTVMSRAPVPGETKTRLIPALGAEGAAEFHAACLADVLDVATAWRSRTPAGSAGRAITLSITPPASWPLFEAAGLRLLPDVQVVGQRGADLGERMVHGLRAGLDEADVALLIGSDLPLLTPEILDVALTRLTDDAKEIVFGPALDGGYYLIGVSRKAHRWQDVLASQAWGTGNVLERAVARARELGLRAGMVDGLPDADTPEDLREILAHPLVATLSGRRSLNWLQQHVHTP